MNEDTRGKELYNRLERLRQNYAPHGAHHQRMAPYIAPTRLKTGNGANQVAALYDSTSPMAAELLSQFVAGHVITPSQQWLGWDMEDPRESNDEIREYFEECRTLSLKRIDRSAFYAEGTECIIDYTGFGTGLITGEEAPQPINETIRGFRGFYWVARKTGNFFIEEGPDGTVDTSFEEMEITARVAAAREDWRMPENIRTALEKKEFDRPFKFFHAVYPRPKMERKGYGNLGMPWASCWVEQETKTIVGESGYPIFPSAAPRYMKTPGEVFGRGRGHIAYPDTWSLNSAKRMGFEDWALKIRPPMAYTSNAVLNALRLVPASPIPVNTGGKRIQDVIMPLETGGRPEVSQIKEEELRASIRLIFFVEHILKLLETEKSEMTAFEFARKIELLFRILGPVYGRMRWEFLTKVADIIWFTQWYARAFPPPPPSFLRSSGRTKVVFKNPLEMAQRSGDIEALAFAISDLAPFMEVFGQSIFDRIDKDRTADGIYERRGVPATFLRSDAELKKYREAQAERTKQELEMQNMSMLAETAGKAAPAMKLMMDAPKK